MASLKCNVMKTNNAVLETVSNRIVPSVTVIKFDFLSLDRTVLFGPTASFHSSEYASKWIVVLQAGSINIFRYSESNYR